MNRLILLALVLVSLQVTAFGQSLKTKAESLLRRAAGNHTRRAFQLQPSLSLRKPARRP